RANASRAARTRLVRSEPAGVATLGDRSRAAPDRTARRSRIVRIRLWLKRFSAAGGPPPGGTRDRRRPASRPERFASAGTEAGPPCHTTSELLRPRRSLGPP